MPATHLLVFTANADGEMASGVSVFIGDLGVPVDALLSSLIFADSKLAACINGTGATCVSDLTSLFCTFSGITELTGIEAFTRLTFLSLCNNSIGSVSALASLTSLTTLFLFGNSITTGVAG